MDVSPPPFHSSSSWYVLWALWVGSFWKCQRQRHPGDSLGVAGGGPRAALLSTAGLCLLRPLLARPPCRPFFRCVAKWGRLLFGVAGGGGDFSLSLSPQHHCFLPVSLSPSLPLFLSLLSPYLWIGPKELQKCHESENVRSG